MSSTEKHDDHEPRTISLVPSTIAFGFSAVLGFAGMFAILLFNHHGGF